MVTMTPTQADAVWFAIDDQRRRTADLLDQLTEAQWQQPSLCDGWTVRHVAAHLTMQQQSIGDAAAFIARHPSMLGSLTLNRVIHDSAVIRSRVATTDEIVLRIRATIGSRRHNAFVTPLETLSDILVHSQDIAIPLGIDLEMSPTASAIAATRLWDTRGSWLATVFSALPLDGYRLVADDTEWTRGQGPEIRGPMGALLLLLTGRRAALARLTGDGAEALRVPGSRW